MARSLFHGDGKASRRRWLIGIAVFTAIAILIAVTTYQRPKVHGDVAFPPFDSPPGLVKDIPVGEFIKPAGLKIIALVFYGRRSRVEISRCFLEVSELGDPGHGRDSS